MSDHSSPRDGSRVPPGHADASGERADATASATALLNAHWDAVADYADLCAATPEDGMRLATEAFRRGIRETRNRRTRGWGQRLPWLPLLLTSVRMTAADWQAHRNGDRLDPEFRVWLSSDRSARYAAPPRDQPLALRGLRDLPEADGELLWSVEVESRSAEAVARQLGYDTAYATEEITRVRAAFRQRCQRNHVDTLTDEECRSYAKLLDAATRTPDAPSPADLWQHLARCTHCREAAACLYLHGGGLPGALAGGVLGWGGHPYLERRRQAATQGPGAGRAVAPARAVRAPLWERLRDRVLDRAGAPWLSRAGRVRGADGTRRPRGIGATGGTGATGRAAGHGRAGRRTSRRARTAVILAVLAVVALAALVALTRTAAVSDNRSEGPTGHPGTGISPGSPAPATSSPGGPVPSGSKSGSAKKPGASRSGSSSPPPSPSKGGSDPGSTSGHGSRPGRGAEDPSPRPPSASADCTARFTLVDEWSDGFQAEVYLTSREALDNWRVTWTFHDSQHVTQMWDGAFTQHGSQVTATARDYNQKVDAGATFSMGFVGSRHDRNSAPGGFTLNGRPCSD
ncbi:cellulose binding domain-containing protein [Streptomyces sp. NPDC005336]|uniref:cellulose binding domain-containing protein n=1 Tax=Streptomyces sp. NPDC005336 TaxID=3157035 RepID=UPI0033A2C289